MSHRPDTPPLGNSLHLSWLQPRRKRAQHRRLLDDAQATDSILAPHDLAERLDHPVDVALRVDAARQAQPHEMVTDGLYAARSAHRRMKFIGFARQHIDRGRNQISIAYDERVPARSQASKARPCTGICTPNR